MFAFVLKFSEVWIGMKIFDLLFIGINEINFLVEMFGCFIYGV